MNKFLKFCLFACSAGFVFSSCAKEVEESADSIEQRVIEAYVKVNYNNTITPTSSGLYIVPLRTGSGASVKSLTGVYVRYTARDLKDNYLSTTVEDIAKQIGSYSASTYYGPSLFEIGYSSVMKGLEEALLTMREGGKVRVILPSWLSEYDFQGSSRTHSTTTIYEIEVLRVIDKLETFITDTLMGYSRKYYDNMAEDSEGYYYKSIEDGIGKVLKENDNIKYWYVGKLLDGFVFDTNIEDTARKYGIYSSSNSYNALDYTVQNEDYTGEGSVVKGMAKTFLKMKHGGEAVTFFSPELGYGSQTKSFGKYQPLFFHVWVVTDNDNDED